MLREVAQQLTLPEGREHFVDRWATEEAAHQCLVDLAQHLAPSAARTPRNAADPTHARVEDDLANVLAAATGASEITGGVSHMHGHDCDNPGGCYYHDGARAGLKMLHEARLLAFTPAAGPATPAVVDIERRAILARALFAHDMSEAGTPGMTWDDLEAHDQEARLADADRFLAVQPDTPSLNTLARQVYANEPLRYDGIPIHWEELTEAGQADAYAHAHDAQRAEDEHATSPA